MTVPDRPVPRVVPNDYDTDPGRFAANLSFRPRAADGDRFTAMARRLATRPAAGPVLELGGGTGPLARQLTGRARQATWVTGAARGRRGRATRSS